MAKTILTESFELYRIATSSDNGYNPESKLIPIDSFFSKEQAMEHINRLDNLDRHVILPVINRTHVWD